MPVQATSSSDTLEVMSNASQPSSKLDEGAERTSGAVLTSPHMATTPSPYKGAGTRDEPYIVDWLAGELENPRNWSKKRKWLITICTSLSVLALTFCSSAYAGAVYAMMEEFDASEIVVTLGISLVLCGFSFGPLLWAPLSETAGRRLLFIVSYGPFAVFNAGSAASKTIEAMLVTRFLGGLFGSSPLTNSGGVVADMFSPRDAGTALTAFSMSPFLGPVLGPIASGFLAETDWRLIFWLMFALSALMFVVCVLVVPETYAPVLLRRRAQKLTKQTGLVHISIHEANKPPGQTLKRSFQIACSRPFAMLLKEPITIALSLYIALVYGLLYLSFVAFPIVYQEGRGWSPGFAGLGFVGTAVGMLFAVALNLLYFNKRYVKKLDDSKFGWVAPENRLPMACTGAVALPIGLFIFAWTSMPNIHWIGNQVGAATFGFGIVLIFLSIITILVDIYLLYAASALAANAWLRSLFGAAFPLFAPYIYRDLGNQWASTLLACLALVFAPIPFLFLKYGPWLRARSPMATAGMPPQLRTLLEQGEKESGEPADPEKQ